MKNLRRLSAIAAIVLAACAATRPEEPWRIEVDTEGGFAGRGIGTYAIDSTGRIDVKKFNGTRCSYEATKDELRRVAKLLGQARPQEWKTEYLPENTCCDRIVYTMTVDEAGAITQTKWIDAPPPMPEDLVALAGAIVGAEDSIRAASTERCR